MKTYKDPGPVDFVDLYGYRGREPVLDEFGQPTFETDEAGNRRMKSQPASMTFKQFLLGRLNDPVFIEKKTGVDAAVLVLETRKRIEDQSKSAAGSYEFEDEQSARLAKATSEPREPYNQKYSHCLVPFMHAVLDGAKG